MPEKTSSASTEAIKILPSLLWIVCAILAFIVFYTPIKDITYAVAERIKLGAKAEIGPLKLEAIKVSPTTLSAPSPSLSVSVDPSLAEKREAIYKDNQNFFISHRLYPSKERGQTYDIWIYVVPHKKDLDSIKSASYYFGDAAWGNRVFTSLDRGKSFGVVVSAYGPMLAYVTIELKDGSTIETWSYIDFENGSLGNRGGV